MTVNVVCMSPQLRKDLNSMQLYLRAMMVIAEQKVMFDIEYV